MTNRTAEEMLQRDIEILGEKQGRLFYYFEQEFFGIVLQWQNYIDIYGSRSRIKILNECNGSF